MTDRQMLRAPEVVRRTGLSRTTIWRQIRAGRFPAPLALSENSIGWPAAEIDAWLGSRQRRTYSASTPVPQPEAV